MTFWRYSVAFFGGLWYNKQNTQKRSKAVGMRKIIFRTSLITLGIVFIFAISAFGILSYCAPVRMMNFAASLGMDTISGDYAFQEYERSGDIGCLARSFIVSAGNKNDRTAEERFDILYSLDGFGAFCADQKVEDEGAPAYDYRGYLCGQAACVKYRLAATDEDRAELISFVLAETAQDFPAGNPAVALAVETARAGDAAFSAQLLEALRARGYEENRDYIGIVTILEGVSNE